MAELETGLPSVRQLQTYTKDKQEIEVKLITNDIVVGKIIWEDTDCLCITDQNDQRTLVWRQAIVYLKPKL